MRCIVLPWAKDWTVHPAAVEIFLFVQRESHKARSDRGPRNRPSLVEPPCEQQRCKRGPRPWSWTEGRHPWIVCPFLSSLTQQIRSFRHGSSRRDFADSSWASRSISCDRHEHAECLDVRVSKNKRSKCKQQISGTTRTSPQQLQRQYGQPKSFPLYLGASRLAASPRSFGCTYATFRGKGAEAHATSTTWLSLTRPFQPLSGCWVTKLMSGALIWGDSTKLHWWISWRLGI